MKRITVIVPAFNAEKTIAKCLDSIMDTVYENYEILVVDDGSADKTAEIVENYRANNVRVLRQENRGVSAARNAAIRESTGDIITFVDSDDYVAAGYLDRIANAFLVEEADVVFWGFQRVNSEGEVLSNHELPKQNVNYYDTLVSLSESDIFGYTWVHAFRKSLLHGISFDESLSIFEDEVFTCNVMKKPVKISYIDEFLYCYVKTESPVLTRRTHQNYYEACEKVYRAWYNLICGHCKGWETFLTNKAGHMNVLCKYYMLERKIDIVQFAKGWSNCRFLTESSTQDRFINLVKAKRWLLVLAVCAQYRLRIAVSRFLRKMFKRKTANEAA